MTAHYSIVPLSNLLQWGTNSDGQIGDNTQINRSSPVQTIAGGFNWRQLANGPAYTAAIKTDGTLWVWGNGTSGKLGTGTTTDRSSPVQTIAGGTNWKQVACGLNHTAAIKTDGTLWVWGDNFYGQLGDGTSFGKSSPVQTLTGGTDWKQVSCGRYHTAAVKTDGTLWTWGNNSFYGQLGDNTQINRSSPVQTIAGGTDWKQVACGQDHTSAIKTDGTLWGWGYDLNGQLGDNANTLRSSPVQTIAGGTDWKQVACGQDHTAAIKTDGTLWTWGRGIYGKLGNNSITNRSSPVQTSLAGTDWKYVNASFSYTVAIKTDSSLWVWGLNDVGQLGDGTIVDKSSPVQQGSLTNWIVAGDYDDANPYTTSLGLTSQPNSNSPGNDFDSLYIRKDMFTEGALWNWGYNANSQLGISSISPMSSPVQTTATGTTWKTLSYLGTGVEHQLSIRADGTLWAWGYNWQGQLGDTTVILRSSPVQIIVGSTNWKQVSVGGYHSTAIRTDNTLWTWGWDAYGQLGNGATADISSPIQIGSMTNWKQVSAGYHGSAAVKTDGTLWTWGSNDNGQLGDNSLVPKSSPVQTIAGGTDWKLVSAGYIHTAAIKNNGQLWVWGAGSFGQLGNNFGGHFSSPIQLGSFTNWKQVACGSFHTVALKTDGTLWTWGQNTDGQLGINTTTNRSSPVQVSGNNWRQISTGGHYIAAVKTDGSLWTWGRNSSGQLGDGTSASKSSPIQVGSITEWKTVACGYSYTTGLIEAKL